MTRIKTFHLVCGLVWKTHFPPIWTRRKVIVRRVTIIIVDVCVVLIVSAKRPVASQKKRTQPSSRRELKCHSLPLVITRTIILQLWLQTGDTSLGNTVQTFIINPFAVIAQFLSAPSVLRFTILILNHQNYLTMGEMFCEKMANSYYGAEYLIFYSQCIQCEGYKSTHTLNCDADFVWL